MPELLDWFPSIPHLLQDLLLWDAKCVDVCLVRQELPRVNASIGANLLANLGQSPVELVETSKVANPSVEILDFLECPEPSLWVLDFLPKILCHEARTTLRWDVV